ncbi:MAG: hypothetical protein R3A13_10470 [Bdellovibrionota bacterium]
MFRDALPDEISQLELQFNCQLDNSPDSPLVFLVHGRAGSVKSMSPFRRCIPEEFNVIQMQAPFSDEIGGWSWWKITKSSQENLSMALEASEILEDFIRQSIEFFSLQPSKLIGLGFSQGGIVLSLLTQSNPELFQKVALLASRAFKHPQSKLTRTGSKLEVLAAHGTQDTAVTINDLKESLEIYKTVGINPKIVTDEVTHKVGSSGMRELKNWLAEGNASL